VAPVRSSDSVSLADMDQLLEEAFELSFLLCFAENRMRSCPFSHGDSYPVRRTSWTPVPHMSSYPESTSD